MTRARPGLGKRLLITALVTFAILAAGEVSLRLWAYNYRHPHHRFDARLGMIRLNPGNHDYGRLGIIRVNSLGYRGREFTREKPPGVFRIVMLGDSVTFGVPGDDCDYPAALQSLFDRNGGRRVEVINAAVEGYNSRDALQLLQAELLGYSPDLVTALIGWNDLIKQDPARPAASALRSRLAYTLYDVYLVKFWRRFTYLTFRRSFLRVERTLSSEEEASFRTYVPLVYTENLEQIIAATRAAGGKVVLFTLPSLLRPDITEEDIRKLYFPHFTYNLRTFLLLHERYNEAIRRVGREQNVAVIDLQEPLRGRESELFMDTAHLECQGYRILASYLHGHATGLVQTQPRKATANGKP
jgi:lysophospholipase L1-like esterase